MKRLLMFPLLLSALALTGCLAEDVKPSSNSAASSSWFEGIQSATNLGGTPTSVRLSWNPSLQSVQGYRIYTIVQSGGSSNWTLVNEVAANITSYTDTGLISGGLYTYRVRAIDMTGNEDTNNKTAATVAFDGIADVVIMGPTTLQARINSALGSFDEVRIYAQPKNGGTKILMGRIQGSATTLDMTTLRSGITYRFNAQAYMGFAGGEDGNQVYVERQSPSESFGTGDPVESLNEYKYRGFMSAMVYGAAPGQTLDPADNARAPNTRLARLTWVPFQNSNSSTHYRLFRVKNGTTLDTSVTTACTPALTTTCVVCDKTGGGPQTCEDTQIPPFDSETETAFYHYAVTMVKTDPALGDTWAEELPLQNTSEFQLSVPMPPNNMVLVQRDTVNYEQCQILGRTSDPRKYQRCSFTAMGAAPVNSGPNRPLLNLPTSYYDFGYNLFADRWTSMCNWTRQSAGGMCGDTSAPGDPQPGDCIGGSTVGTIPSTSDPNWVNKGKIGDVFYFIRGTNAPPYCYIKGASGWTAIHTTGTLTDPDDWKKILSNDPQANNNMNFPLRGVSQTNAWAACQSQTTGYGKKRLPRRREHIATQASAWMQGEPYATTSQYRARVFDGLDGVMGNFRQCSPNTADLASTELSLTNVTDWATFGLNAFKSITNWRAQVRDTTAGLNYGGGYRFHEQFFPGNPYTTGCISRQGMHLTSVSIVSDRLIRQADTGAGRPDFLGLASPYDNGNTDLAGFHFNGVRGWSSASNVTQTYLTGAAASPAIAYLNTALGLPLVAKDPINEDVMTLNQFNALPAESGSKVLSETAALTSPVAVGTVVYPAGQFYQRFDVSYRLGGTAVSSNEFFFVLLRCVQEAE
ncbi:MAG: fibronectin type III domain-containing protein [Bdellovibrionaceae bacterium]|nr:fibronectin type III domain-containing protein [Pseudobdellovibrionaceae bacterium]